MSKRPVREDLVLQACLEAYGLVRHEQWLSDRALDHVLRSKRTLYSTERRAVAERVYALLRRQRMVDHLLPKAFGKTDKRPVTQVDLLRFAVSRVLDGEHPSAVVDALALPGEAAAQLARVSGPAALGDLPANERLAVEASLPDALARRLAEQLGDDAAGAVQALNERAPLCVRVNTLKATREDAQRQLEAVGVRVRRTTRSPLGLFLETRVNVYALAPFKQGVFEVQDEGSQLLGLLMDGPKGRVIDACAGAGGKTLQLAAQLANKGELIAMDVDVKRLGELKTRARRAGVHNVRTIVLPPAGAAADEALRSLEGTADRVLIDAPCTGTGTLRRKPDARYRFDDQVLADHTARQRELIDRFARLVKPGGRLVYGTCSLLREENEAVVDDFLRRTPTFARVDAGRLLGAASDCTTDGALRLFPHRHGTDGFFGAVLERSR